MKLSTTFLLSCLICCVLSTTAQTIDGNEVTDIEAPYMEVIVRGNHPLSRNIRFMVRTGESDESKMFKQTEIKDDSGNALQFRTHLELLNYLHEWGYRLVSSVETDEGEERYILHR